MKEKEYDVARARCSLEQSESRLREAQADLRSAERKHAAIFNQARATAESELSRLSEVVTRAQSDFRLAKDYVAHCQAKLECGFEQ